MIIFDKKYLICILILLSLPPYIEAQILPFDHYSVKDGLPSNWISAIYQDSFGYIWLGTDEGITKYDGISFTNYGHDQGLPVNHVWAITESKINPGSYWVGTHGGGLCKFTNDVFTQINLGEEISSNVVVALHEDEDGRVWCATNTGLIQVIDENVIIPDGFERKPVTFLKSDKENNIWAGIGDIIYKILPGSDQSITFSPGFIRNDRISTFEKDEQGNIWLGTVSGELFLVREDETGSLIPITSITIGGYPVDMKADRQGNVWIAHQEHGISVASRNNNAIDVINYSTNNGLVENRISSCFIDMENNIWIGNYSRGLSKLSHKNIYLFYFRDPFSALQVENGHLFLASEGGIAEIWESSSGAWKRVFHILDKGSIEGEPYSLVGDREGNIAVLFVGGIGHYKIYLREDNPSEFRLLNTFTRDKELPNGKVVSLNVDADNTLWAFIGDTITALNLNNGRVQNIYTEKDGMPGIDVRTMLHDRDGNFWFGDFVNGLSYFTKIGTELKFQKKFTKDIGLPDNNIRIIAQRSNGDIWIGTRFGGIAVIRDDEINHLITVEDGLLSNGVWSIAEDPEQRVWIATSLGINILEPGSMRVSSLHKLKGYFTGSIGVLANGTVWAVGRNELIFYKHRSEPETVHSPPIGITEFRVNGKDFDIASGLKFPYDENSVIVSFGGISFRDEKYLRYRYRLHGLDSLWSEPSHSRYVTYGSLSPGSYMFEVVAITSDSATSLVPATMSFVISPPMWKQWWFITISVLLLLSAVIGLEQMRVRRILKIERIRSTIATDLHDDIGAGLTHIGLLSEVLLKKYKSQTIRTNYPVDPSIHDSGRAEPMEHEVLKSVEHIGSISRELSGAMGDVVWSINPKYDSLESLLKRISSFAHEMCRTKNISIEFTYPDEVHKIKMNPEMRRNLLLIIKEAITNAVKYSQTSSIEVEIRSQGTSLTVTVKDFGIGFDINSNNDGNGIFNIRNRTLKIGGECSIVSRIGEGTTITIHVPLQ